MVWPGVVGSVGWLVGCFVGKGAHPSSLPLPYHLNNPIPYPLILSPPPPFHLSIRLQGLIRRFKHVVEERIEKPEAYDPAKYFQARSSLLFFFFLCFSSVQLPCFVSLSHYLSLLFWGVAPSPCLVLGPCVCERGMHALLSATA